MIASRQRPMTAQGTTFILTEIREQPLRAINGASVPTAYTAEISLIIPGLILNPRKPTGLWGERAASGNRFVAGQLACLTAKTVNPFSMNGG